MGRRNTSGMKTTCNHCGYTWFTNSESDITSCPNCGWRVRLKPSVKRNVAGQSLGQQTESKDIHYYV